MNDVQRKIEHLRGKILNPNSCQNLKVYNLFAIRASPSKLIDEVNNRA